MTDPRTILSAAGVSLPEVEEYAAATSDYNRDADRRVLHHDVSGAFFVMDAADAAILALAGEVARLSASLDVACEAVRTWQMRAWGVSWTIESIREGALTQGFARYAEEASDGS